MTILGEAGFENLINRLIFMFEALFGNLNIQRILIFLYINSRCYGVQLHRLLNVPLTPIQKALQRLELGGIIVSYHEGKTRLYQFNPAFPLREELAQHASSKSIFNPEVDTQTGTTPTRIAGWRMTAYLITVAVIGIVIILIAENCV